MNLSFNPDRESDEEEVSDFIKVVVEGCQETNGTHFTGSQEDKVRIL